MLYLSVFRTEKTPFSRGWARLGLFIALLAFVDFSSEVLRLQSWRRFSFVSIIIGYFSRLLFLPLWLLWLGRQLHQFQHHLHDDEQEQSQRLDKQSNMFNNGTEAGNVGQEMTNYDDQVEEDDQDPMASVFT